MRLRGGNVTAEDILWKLRLYRQQDHIIVPNVCAPWECDMLTITRSGYAHEFEVKVSRSDFLADFKKDKHQLYASGASRQPHPYRGGNHPGWEIPGRFWFVTLAGIVKAEDVPDYAGWIEVAPKWSPKQMKRAPQIHREKTSEAYRIKALHSMMFRYWQLRGKGR